MKGVPSVSVVVPVLDAARTLPGCLEALDALDPVPHEILLVDNGSKDGSRELLTDFAERHTGHRVRVIDEARRGAAAARNAGIRLAAGEIIAFTDSDCSPAKDWLREVTNPFSDASVAAVAGRVVASPAASTLELFSALYTLRLPETPSRHRRWTPRTGGFPTANFAVRRELALELEGFDEAVEIYGEDYDFCARLYAHGATIAYTPEALVTHHHRTRLKGLLRQSFGFGRGQAFVFRRHGARLLWIDLPRRTLAWESSPVSAWLDLGSADKKLLALVLLGVLYPPLWWALPLYGTYLTFTCRARARDTGVPASTARSGQLAALLLLKSAAMTAGRWRGSAKYGRLCF